MAREPNDYALRSIHADRVVKQQIDELIGLSKGALLDGNVGQHGGRWDPGVAARERGVPRYLACQRALRPAARHADRREASQRWPSEDQTGNKKAR